MRTFAVRAVAALALSAGTFSAAAASAGSAAGPVISHHPRISAGTRATGWSSSNWSGYAITGANGTFTKATGVWIVPSVSPTRKATYSSSWVGIDGFNNSNLIQTGTEQDYYNGSAHYNAWWEILPAAETRITTITVNPGDKMTASITEGAGGIWTITISDSNGQSFTTQQAYSGQLSSAEWIQEAPTVGGRVAPLAHYSSPDTFDPGTVNGGNPGLVANDGGVMIQNGAQVSTPSVPDGDTDGFNVSYGSTAPAAPAS